MNAEHETGTAFLDLLPDTSQKYLGLYQRRQPGRLKDRDAAQHADGAHQLRRAGVRRRRLRRLRRKERAALHCRGHRGVHAARLTTPRATALWPRPANSRRRAWRRLAALKESNPAEYALLRQAIAHLVMGLGGEDDERHQGAHRSLRGGARRRSPTRSLLKPSRRCC